MHSVCRVGRVKVHPHFSPLTNSQCLVLCSTNNWSLFAVFKIDRCTTFEPSTFNCICVIKPQTFAHNSVKLEETGSWATQTNLYNIRRCILKDEVAIGVLATGRCNWGSFEFLSLFAEIIICSS